MPILGIIASSRPSAAVDTGAMFPLQVITVGPAGASSVSFTNIPNTYTHLQVRGIARSDRASTADNLGLRFNSDSGNNYTMHFLHGDGATATAEGYTGQSYAIAFSASTSANASANIFGSVIYDILDYTNTNKNKTVRALGGNDRNGAGTISFNSAAWLSTNAITSITVFAANSNLVQNSQFALYGIKAAS